MAVNESVASDKPVSTLWGCELSAKSRSCTFRADDAKFEHQLALRTMCLGATASADEFNVVELVTEQGGESKAFPLATLRASGMLTVNLSGMELSPPVTFRLKSGSGPVHVCAEHVALEEFSSEEVEEGEEEERGEEEEEEEEDEGDEDEPSPKLEKKRATRSAGKRKKPEEADEDVDASDDNPPKKGKGRGRKQLGKSP